MLPQRNNSGLTISTNGTKVDRVTQVVLLVGLIILNIALLRCTKNRVNPDFVKLL